MKICMLYHPRFMNLEKDSRVLKEAKSLSVAGHEVVIICLDKFNEKFVDAFGQKIRCIGNNFKPQNLIALHKRLGITTRKKFPFWLDYLVLRERPDAIHVHDYEPLTAGVLAGKILNVPIVYDAHEYLPGRMEYGNTSDTVKRMSRFIERFLRKRCSATITVNESIAKLMVTSSGEPIPVLLQNFSELVEYKKTTLLRDELNISNDSKIVLYVGGISKTKGITTIFKLAKQFPKTSFVLMGHGELEEEFMNEIHQKGLNNIYLKSSVAPEDVIAWSSSADIGIHSILNESSNHYNSLGNKVGEYIMAGLPIAVSDFPEMRKLAIQEDMGVVFDPDSPENIAKAFDELLEPETYARKKKNVMEKRKNYCWENEEKRLIALYENIKK